MEEALLPPGAIGLIRELGHIANNLVAEEITITRQIGLLEGSTSE